MRAFGIVVLLAIFSAGCTASVQYAGRPQLISSELVANRNYEIDQRQQAYVGEPMIRVQEFRVDRYTGSEVEISNGFSINGPGLNYQYAEGQNFPYGGRTHLYDQDMHFFRMGTLGVVFDEAGRVQDKVLNLASYGPPVFLIYTFQTDSQSGDVGLIESERRNVAADGQNFEIIYSGMGSGSIRLNYREFTNNDMARQAFFQELSYPVGSETIRFRDIVIQVHEVSSESIEYSVLSHSGPS